jgi:hypothetical protein
MLIGIEVNHGAVVEALLAKQLPVCSINPKLLDRLRDRFSPAGAKDDRRDAFVLASCVESDAYAFRRIERQRREHSTASGDTTSRGFEIRTESERQSTLERVAGVSTRTSDSMSGGWPAVVVGFDREGSVPV